MIEADVDRYGTLARASSMADYLELLALNGRVCRRAELEDLIRDRGFSNKQVSKIDLPDALEDDEPVSLSEAAYDCLDERADEVTGYPFARDTSGQVRYTSGSRPEDLPYIALLSISLAHAYSVETADIPNRVFETMVARAMGAHGMKVAQMGASGGQNFVERLAIASGELEVPADAGASSRRKSSNDNRVDIIGHLSWRDTRPGRWLYLCQATCAKSDEWLAKMKEPSPESWKRIFGNLALPQAFLAVPHHVEWRTLYDLTFDDGRIVVDRLRLANLLESTTVAEKDIIARVLQSPVETLDVA